MSKEEVLAEFEIDIKDAGLQKDGALFYESILKRAKRLVIKDRKGVIEALRCWIRLRHEGLIVTAINLIADLVIPELKPELEILRKEIESGKTLLPYYNEWVERALKAIN